MRPSSTKVKNEALKIIVLCSQIVVLAQHGLAQDGFASLDDFEFITESDGTVSWGWWRPGHVITVLTSDWSGV